MKKNVKHYMVKGSVITACGGMSFRHRYHSTTKPEEVTCLRCKKSLHADRFHRIIRESA